MRLFPKAKEGAEGKKPLLSSLPKGGQGFPLKIDYYDDEDDEEERRSLACSSRIGRGEGLRAHARSEAAGNRQYRDEEEGKKKRGTLASFFFSKVLSMGETHATLGTQLSQPNNSKRCPARRRTATQCDWRGKA